MNLSAPVAFLILGLWLLVVGKLVGKNLERVREVPPIAVRHGPLADLEEFKRSNRLGAAGMVWVGILCLLISAVTFVVKLVT